MKKMASVACSWAGIILIQIATIPSIYNILVGTNVVKPPVDMVILLWTGILLFLIRSILNKEWIYVISNSIGLATQTILLILITR